MYGKSDQVSKLIRDATDRWEALFNVSRPKFEDEQEAPIEEEQAPEIAGLVTDHLIKKSIFLQSFDIEFLQSKTHF